MIIRRRHFLALIGGFAFARHLAVAQQTLPTTALLGLVPGRVREREAVSDAISIFRRGASERIDAAMQQYVQVLAEFAPALPLRLIALDWAFRKYLIEATRAGYGRPLRHEHLEGSVTSFGKGDHKCNKLVADAYAHGAGAGLSVGADWFSEGQGRGWPAMRIGADLWPPRANHLADPEKNMRSLTNARPLRDPGDEKAQPELGDLIAFPSASGDESGHVGLYVGRNLIISAKESGLEVGTVEAETAAHQGIVRIRKFNGSGR